MPQLNRLSSRQVKAMIRNGVEAKDQMVADGGGLYLRLRKSGGADWVFVKTIGKRREAGLGSASVVDLDSAREAAAEMRRAIAQGRNPFDERAAAKQAAKEAARVPTFGEFAEEYIASIETQWRNDKHRQSVPNSLRTHAASLSKIPIDEVGTDDVLKVLRPIWSSKPDMASRVRGRIELVLSAAKAKGLRPRDSFNPATWRGHLSILLPSRDRASRDHHEALPYAEAPAFMALLQSRPALSARALEFTILTAARTGEVIGAKWGEIDFDVGVWTVPAERMKAHSTHRVPLSKPAVALLQKLRPKVPDPTELVFASEGRPLSNMAMMALLKRMKVDVTVHGFRSTFRDWVGEETDFPSELAEWALAHRVGGTVERAYRRQTAVERRRELMEAWAKFLAEPKKSVPKKPKARKAAAKHEADALQVPLGL